MECAAAVCPAVVVVGAGERRHDRYEPRRTMDRRPQLRRASVREAGLAHTTLAARQSDCPRYCIVAILLFVFEGIPVTFGHPTTATILDHDHIPIAGIPR